MSYHPPRAARSDTWTSPPDLVADAAWLAGVDGWDLDLAAAPGTAAAPRWWGPDHPDPRARDLLADAALPGRLRAHPAPWAAWANPPYSRWSAWAAWAHSATEGGLGTVALCVFARTDTAAWHDHVAPHATVAYRRGRVRFGGAGPAPAPTVVAMFGRRRADLGALVAPSGAQWWVR